MGIVSALGTNKMLSAEEAPSLLKEFTRKDYLKITKLNDQLDSYTRSFNKAEFGPLAAAFASKKKSEKVSQFLGPERVGVLGKNFYPIRSCLLTLQIIISLNRKMYLEKKRVFPLILLLCIPSFLLFLFK